MTDTELLIRIRHLKQANKVRWEDIVRLQQEFADAEREIQVYEIMLLDSVNEEEARCIASR